MRYFAAMILASACLTTSTHAAEWQQLGDRYATKLDGIDVSCSLGGTVHIRDSRGANLRLYLFTWFDDWQYRQPDGKGATISVDHSKVGTLTFAGTWGPPEIPLSCTISLQLTEDNHLRIRTRQTRPEGVSLVSGVWAGISIDRATLPANSRLDALPGSHGKATRVLHEYTRELRLQTSSSHNLNIRFDPLTMVRTQMTPKHCTLQCRLIEDLPANQAVERFIDLSFSPVAPARPQPRPKALRLGDTVFPPIPNKQNEPAELDIDVSGVWTNPYDPAQIAVDAAFTTPSGQTFSQPAFYIQDHIISQDGDGQAWSPSDTAGWRVRFTPTEVGNYQCTLIARTEVDVVTRELPPIKVTLSDSPGILRSPADGRYFAFKDGRTFFVIGHNTPVYPNAGQTVDKLLARCKAAGENTLRVWMSSTSLGIDWSAEPGRYRQDRAARLDYLLEAAKRHGIYIILCMDTHQDFRDWGWERNPLNTANGGPLENGADWFSNETAADLYKRRLRYIVARWGAATSLLAWEFCNEAQGWFEDNEAAAERLPEILAWHKQMSTYLAGLDAHRHPITTSWWNGSGPADCWALPNMSAVQTHFYSNDEVGVTKRILSFCDNQRDTPLPHIIAEFGISADGPPLTLDPDGVALHNAAWAALHGGAASIAMPWWHDRYIDGLNQYHHFTAIAAYLEAANFNSQNWRHTPIDLDVNDGNQPSRPVLIECEGTFAKAPTSTFTIESDGSRLADSPHAFLQGDANSELKNPPSFTADFFAAGSLDIHIDTVSSGAHLKVWIDDLPVLDRELPAGADLGKESNYTRRWRVWRTKYDETISVPVPAGRHTIRIANDGPDWMRVTNYTFHGIVKEPILDVGALQSPTTTLLWLHNPASNWKTPNAEAVTNAVVRVGGVPRGARSVRWWDTRKNAVTRTETITVGENGILSLAIGPVARDMAVIVQ